MVKGIFNAAVSINKNAVRFSRLYSFAHEGKQAETVAIKYVMRGMEHYQTEHRNFQLNAGEFLLLNPGNIFSTFLEGKELTEGLCIDLDKHLFQKVYTTVVHDDEFLLGNPHYLSCEPEVIEGVYKINENPAGDILAAYGAAAINNKGCIAGFTEEHYFSLAQALTINQLQLSKEIRSIKTKKPTVQKELHRRISLTKLFINEHLNENLSIDRLSSVAQMSPFHFIRTFKQVYGVSPHQFLLSKRLEESYQLLISDKFSVSEVADNCGFADIFSFSKSFKKRFGVAPSCINKKS